MGVADDHQRLALNKFEQGNALADSGRIAEAIAALSDCVRLKPDFAEAHNNLGNALKCAGRLEDAAAAYQNAVRSRPDCAEIYLNIASLLKDLKRYDEAARACQESIRLKPALADAYGILASILLEAGELDQAIAVYGQLLRLRPNDAGAHSNIGVALRAKGKFDDAILAHQAAIRLRPDYAEAYYNLGNALKDVAQIDGATAAFRRALELKPRFPQAHSNLIYTLQYHPDCDARLLCEECRRWDREFGVPLKNRFRIQTNNRDPHRRLRVGYVSPDFYQHCQSHFTIPLLANHDRKNFEIICYSHVLRPDATTERIRGLVDGWRRIEALTDADAARLIHADKIDILVDLTMHMAGSRLGIFAHHPAPMQVMWLAYPGTTGVSAMNYRITDPYLDPPGDEGQYTERSVRLAETFWCYEPLCEETDPGPLPMTANGFVTFGSLNNFCKVNPGVLRLWARVMRAVERSRIMILAPEGCHRESLLAVFEMEKVARERVQLVTPRPRGEYLQLYRQVDVGLDTMPYNGHTTSLDSYWMGVPVVTLAGQTVVGRAGVSQLSNLGLADLIARTPDEFVGIATNLAGTPARMEKLRRTLRTRMKTSPLMDGSRFARNMEQAFREMWREWCVKG
jgi:predicted O-linked N-acetylglucosamine transferase (SPINDLY family)